MCRPDKIVALILAAGFSSRMGEFKPLLCIDGIAAIEHAVTSFRRAGITDIRVVVGHRANELIPILRSLHVMPIVNNQFSCGMFSSIIAGLATFGSEVEGCFLLPGDMPLVKSRTLGKLIEAYYQTDSSIIYPKFLGQRGHPPLITRKCFAEIRLGDLSGNLRLVLQKFEKDACDVNLIDQAIMLDMDTPQDYQRVLQYQMNKRIPTIEECEAIFSEYHITDRVIRHGRAVARIARKLTAMLNTCSCFSLDMGLITAGCLLHDIAKGTHNHAWEGAVLLESLGFPDVAPLIARHMDLEFKDQDIIDETVIVYLADKIIKDEALIPIAERFVDATNRYATNPAVLQKIEKRRGHAMFIKQKIECYLEVNDLLAVLPSREG